MAVLTDLAKTANLRGIGSSDGIGFLLKDNKSEKLCSIIFLKPQLLKISTLFTVVQVETI